MSLHRLPDIDTLKFQNLTFGFNGQDPALKNCDFDFPVNRVVWIKSPEGAGKSTLLQIMAGLVIPHMGSYMINDENVVDMSFEEFLPYRLRIGFTFDYGGLINNRTIADNILLPLVYHKLISESEAVARVDRMIERFDLKKYKHERPAHVPGRVRKLAVLLRGLVAQPQLLLLDDPSVGLGEATQNVFTELIQEMRDDGTLRHIFVSSYDDQFMQALNPEVIHLDGGLLYHQMNDKVVGV